MLSQPKNDTHVWEINLSLLPTHKASLYTLLNADEKERCLKYKNDALRTSFIACRGSLREILSHYEPSIHPSLWHFKTTTYGRPFLFQHHPFSFNLTHTKDAAYCVLSPNPICGIDTESIVPIDLSSSFCDYTLTPHERHIIQSLPIAMQDSAFTKYWCLKEARLKAIGIGLTTPMNHFSIPLNHHHLTHKGTHLIQTPQWDYHLFSPSDTTVLALVQSHAPKNTTVLFHKIG
jgi:4'-phosphopantetheinyl transferase